eukprot:1706797-Rhodomonas_salina.1
MLPSELDVAWAQECIWHFHPHLGFPTAMCGCGRRVVTLFTGELTRKERLHPVYPQFFDFTATDKYGNRFAIVFDVGDMDDEVERAHSLGFIPITVSSTAVCELLKPLYRKPSIAVMIVPNNAHASVYGDSWDCANCLK